MAGIPTFGFDALGQYFGAARYDGGGVGGLAGQTDFQTTALDTGKTTRVDFGGRRGRGFVLCAAGGVFRADAAQRFDVGGVCLGLVARQPVFGLDGVVAGFGSGVAARSAGGFGRRHLAVVRLGCRLDLGFGRSSERTRLAFGCTRTMGGDGVVGGIVGLYFCVVAHHQPFGQCGDDSLVFLGTDAFGATGVGIIVCAFAMDGGRFGGIHFARLGLAGGGIA